MLIDKRRLAGISVAFLVASGTVALSSSSASAADCGYLFDDFHYASSSDASLTGHGWTPRSSAGGPGVAGATWSPNSISFPTSNGDKVMQLTASTDGTSGGTNQAELYSTQKRFLDGTYASRIKFSDTPVSGSDGDHVNETFFAISPLNGDLDPTYSELDFSEYLPNGGWGVPGPINYQTSWYTYQNDPWYADNVSNSESQSYDGWHNLVVQVANGHMIYYIDGVQVADHSGKYYPRQTMTINWNEWFIDTAGHTGGLSTYAEQVDWVLFTKNQVLTPAQATAQAAAYRTAGNAYTDSISSTGAACATPQPTGTPTTGPTTTPTTTPTTPPTAPPPANCSNAPEWSFSQIYTGGSVVKHEKSKNGDPSGPPSGEGEHLWKAKYWTQGSEPGWTDQWQDLGAC
jgi:hypothetical protein